GIVAMLEAGTRLAFSRISAIETRISDEHRTANSIRPIPGRPSLLLVGNSLLLHAVDMPLLKQLLPGNARAYRYVIEQTYLLDWQYGIRRLFADGSRPDKIVVVVGAVHVRPVKIRGDYSSYYLFRTADLPEIASMLDYDLTKESSLYFARYSLFFAGRNNLRNFVLNKLDPAYSRMLHALATGPAPKENPDLIGRAAYQRLSAMRRDCDAHGAKLIFVIAPGAAPEEIAAVVNGARDAGVECLVPSRGTSFPPSLFEDGFHLNATGATRFTHLLAPELANDLGEIARAASWR
ncbi:MAG TPA: hypothetical protein VHB50_04075, partial [Bryobacteraceae bacterium]|nr:hypothetical protein [Bryobacteraceae bacterium]